MPEPIVRLRDVGLKYSVPSYPPYLKDYLIRGWRMKLRQVTALNGVSFEVREGDRLGIVGRNGSGKSSLCRMIGGAIRPTSGSVERNFDSVRLIEDQFFYSEELTGLENLNFLVSTFPPRIEPKKAIAQAALFSGLGEHLTTPIKFYSKGMRSRLFLSTTLLNPTELLLLDEAFSGADEEFQDHYFSQLEHLLDQCRGVVLVSHQERILSRYCNRLMVLDGGNVLHLGGVQAGLEKFWSLKSPEVPPLVHQGSSKAVLEAAADSPNAGEGPSLR